MHGNKVGFKSEYGDGESFCDSGEYFWGGTKTKEDCLKIMVIPLEVIVTEEQI